MIGTYAVINKVNNRSGYYITETVRWDPDNNRSYIPNGEYRVRLPDFNETDLHTVINGNLKCVCLPAIDDKYDPNTSTFTRPNSDSIIWSPWDVDNPLPRLKSYRCIEYKEFPNQSIKTGYYATQLVHHKVSNTPNWFSLPLSRPASESSDNKFYIGYQNNWSYTKDKDGVATTVTLPDINVKIPTKDTWILPIIAYSS